MLSEMGMTAKFLLAQRVQQAVPQDMQSHCTHQVVRKYSTVN